MKQDKNRIEGLRENIRSGDEVAGEAFAELLSPPKTVMIDAWPTFNRMTGGFQMKALSVFCGGTGQGKTDFMANISANLCLQEIPHYVASVETGDTDFFLRVLSKLSNRDLNTGEKFDLGTIREIDKIWGRHIRAKHFNLAIHNNRISIECLLRELEIAHKDLGCKLAILDNLSFFLEATSTQNSIMEMDRVIHELIMFCKRTPMHLILVCHPRKTEGRVESEYDIKGSSTAVQEAHNVFLFNRPSQEQIENGVLSFGHRELKFAKLRKRGANAGKKLIFTWKDRTYDERFIIGRDTGKILGLDELPIQTRHDGVAGERGKAEFNDRYFD